MKLAWCVPYLHGSIHLPTLELWVGNNRNYGIQDIIVYGYWDDMPIEVNEYIQSHNITKRNYNGIPYKK